MYLHPQEVDYDIEALFRLIDQSGLKFLGFSNPAAFDLERIFKGNDELLEMARGLGEREQYQLIELLDPESVTHFEFFLTSLFLKHVFENGNIGDAVEHSSLSMDSVRSLIARSVLYVPSSD